MGNYDSVRELVGAFKVLASLMVALDGAIARLSKHWFVLNVLRWVRFYEVYISPLINSGGLYLMLLIINTDRAAKMVTHASVPATTCHAGTVDGAMK